jgi:mono/diheme cytochrome c family protein
MVAVGLGMSDSDLAATLTYIRSNWGNKAEEVTTEDVKAVRAQAAKDAQPWTDAQLKAFKE